MSEKLDWLMVEQVTVYTMAVMFVWMVFAMIVA